MLEQKLATLQRLLANTQEASESSWQVGTSPKSYWLYCSERILMPSLRGFSIIFELHPYFNDSCPKEAPTYSNAIYVKVACLSVSSGILPGGRRLLHSTK